jgi:hypothetical protein
MSMWTLKGLNEDSYMPFPEHDDTFEARALNVLPWQR